LFGVNLFNIIFGDPENKSCITFGENIWWIWAMMSGGVFLTLFFLLMVWGPDYSYYAPPLPLLCKETLEHVCEDPFYVFSVCSQNETLTDPVASTSQFEAGKA
jgi:hypothetical protein